ncbi:hypothetical protein ACJD0Z_17855 [Flavobacteriaceae bacterium M23B6Z8]
MIRTIEVRSTKESDKKFNPSRTRIVSSTKSKIASFGCIAAMIALAFLYFQTSNVITLKLLVAGYIIFGLLLIKNQQNSKSIRS